MKQRLLLVIGCIYMFLSFPAEVISKTICKEEIYSSENSWKSHSSSNFQQAYFESLLVNSFLNPAKSFIRAAELAGIKAPAEYPLELANQSLPKICCPDFILQDAVDICPPDGACPPNGSVADPRLKGHGAACRNIAHKYTVYPNDPTFTYTWVVTGGSPNSYTGNPITITWGNGAAGSIKVFVSNAGVGGSCADTLTMELCLIDGPKAGFLVSHDTTCPTTPIHFTNTSLGGSTFHWDFGDGSTSNLANPPDHSYSTPGTYTVTMVTQDMGAGHPVQGSGVGEVKVPCGCIDTVRKVIVVMPGIGPVINYDCCFGTVCAGDTTSFCTPMVCGTYSWSVTNGTIVSGLNTSCIKVKWNAVYSGPTTVSLQSCPSSTCQGTATLNVPVLYPNLPINGPTTVCIGSTGKYSLPWMPGTYYHWQVNGAGLYAFNPNNRNVISASITFNNAGPYWVKCEYNNPMAGCNGVDSVLVNVLPVFAISGDKKVCEGNTTFYNTPGFANWSVSPTGPVVTSGNGTGTAGIQWTPGNYTITAVSLTPGVFCNDTATYSVSVVAKPILGNITGTDTVCPGSKFTYSITSNVSGSPFVWLPTSGTVNILSQMGAYNDSVLLQFMGNGPWVISVFQNIELSPGIYCPSTTKYKTIHPYLPPVITGPSPVCIDAVVQYTANGSSPPGGFQWIISPPNRGTIQSGQGTSSVFIQWHGPPTSASLTVSNCAGSNTKTVVINGPPTAFATYSTTPIFCLGSTQVLTLSTPTGAGYTYQWYKNNIAVGTGTSPNLTINISSFSTVGIYQYYVIVTLNGCSVKSNVINVVIENCGAGGSGSPPPGCTCDAVPFFRPYVVCGNITLVNLSTVVPPSTMTYLWSVSGPGTGTFTPSATVATPTLTVNASGFYTITLTVYSSSGCSCTYTDYANVFLPNASFTYTSPVCMNSPAYFTANPNNPSYSYAWNFGDTSTSLIPVTQHAYSSASPPPFTVSLVITDPAGCIATASNLVTVNPKPTCIISASDTTICPGSYATLTACIGMTSYQWYKNGSALPGETSMTLNAYNYGEYYAEMTNSYGCTGKSNKIFIYLQKPPIAKITGSGYLCAYPSSTTLLNLSTYYAPSYSYNWSSIPAGATFSPANYNSPSISLTLPAALPVTYQFVVEVTDTLTGCISRDTMCVTFYRKPPVTVTPLNACEGTSVVLTATPNNPGVFSYLWSNGLTTPVITASATGFYSVTITNKSTGCSATANAGTIHAKPDLSLFPLGCDSICSTDTLHLYIPLPLSAVAPNNTYSSAYPNIDWYDNGNYGTPIGSGQSFPFVTNVLGSHQISVVVSNSNFCQDTAGVFCLNVRNCPPYLGMDFGDVPDDDILPNDFPTLLASNGARHLITPGVYLGSKVDAEPDGQPSYMAVCDDNDCMYASAGDDEDGVTLPSNVVQGATVTITVVASVSGYLDAWMDFNTDMDWADPGEHVFTNQLLSAGSNTLTFTVPLTANTGICYSRFRFRTANNTINYYGLEQDGEVEDYAMHIDPVSTGALDFGDAPDNLKNPNDYPTLLASNGARHIIVPNVFLGSKIDAESDGQPNITATGDDISGSPDEDGVSIPSFVSPGSTVPITVVASTTGFLDAWMDFNIDGDWADPGEHILITVPLSSGSNALSFNVPATATAGQSYVRFRFRTTSAPINYNGLVADGEVEDYAVTIKAGQMDFGDVPDDDIITTDFPTLLISNGARHLIVPGVYLGSKVDAEPDGQPSYMALCDDNDCLYPSGGDDEDGVTMPSSVVQGSTVTITVVASVSGYLDAWMDFNLDSDWSTPGEHIFTNQPLSAGSNTLTFNVPSTAGTGLCYSRFRFRTSPASINYYGLVSDGEVEDYATTIKPSVPPQTLDFGDIPDDPTNPSDFPTLLSSNGARHTIVPGVYLGMLIDGESDGQPTLNADGDDLANVDDEDGVLMPVYVNQGSTVNITVLASTNGYLDAWVDFNGNGSWGAGIEHIFSSVPLSAGSNSLSFTVPFTAALGQEYARFRFRTSAAPINFDGLVSDGEVEDYWIHVDPYNQESLDFGDAPDNPSNPNDYPTLLSSNGARHLIVPGVYLGSQIDAEPNGQPNPLSSGDDLGGIDDEDGITIPAIVPQGSTVTITVVASVNGYLDAWMDFNLDGDWADPGEHIMSNVALSAGTNTLSFNVPGTASPGQSYTRFRFRTSPASISYNGFVSDGEVEDYAVYIEPSQQQSLDFGDAPDNPDIPNDYPTLLASNGARHIIVPGVFLGTLIDAEADGQPNLPSTGDDISNVDDEDGVVLPPYVLPGSVVSVTVTASVSGYLDAWMDYNLDGDWADAGEHIFTNQPLSAGANVLSFTVPINASMGLSYSRFRFRTSNASINYDGLVNDGEVEDYAVYIEEGAQPPLIDFGDAPDNPSNPNDYPTLLASNGARHTITGGTYLGSSIDYEPDGQPTVAADGDNNSNLNDEDGVTFLWPLVPGSPCKIKVVASVGNALLNMWIDYNGNGSWSDPGDHVFNDINPAAGTNYYTFIVPGNAIPGQTYARFRFSHQAALSFSGPATDGEVEDYRVSIQKSANKWYQIPDNALPGLHSDNNHPVADDWVCNGGQVTEIDWWGNYEMAANGEIRGEGIQHFDVNVYTDNGCSPAEPILSFSVPFNSQQEVNTGQVNSENSIIYKYSYILPIPWDQVKGHTYWLSVRAVSNNALAPAQWRWQEANRLALPLHCSSVSLNDAGGWSPNSWNGSGVPEFSDMAYTVVSTMSKTLSLKVLLEGLYAGNGQMNKAQDAQGDHFGGTTADKLTIELHTATLPYNTSITFNDLDLFTNGSVVSNVPGNYNSSYYLVVKHRNSMETWSATPVSFSNSAIHFDFTSAQDMAFGNNLKFLGGYYAIFAGDANQDGIIDGSDMSLIDNASTLILKGYYTEDVNGDGIVDGSDMSLLDNNSTAIIRLKRP
ncbi:MAG: PKD domain-containing protein [Bacteroidetes bacterium]|nr:PKD domain-containing protein [Bacteroidota bacterium]